MHPKTIFETSRFKIDFFGKDYGISKVCSRDAFCKETRHFLVKLADRATW